MLKSVIFFFPCFVCLIWGLMLLFTQHKGVARCVLTVLMLVSAVYFVADAFFVSDLESFDDYKMMIRMDVLSQFSTLMLIPFLVMYIFVAQGKSFSWPLAYLSLLPAFCQGVASSVIYAVMGFDNAAAFIQAFDALGAFPPEYDLPIYHAHYAVCQNTYNAVLAVEVLLGICYLAFVTYKQRKNKVTYVSMLLLVLLSICIMRIIMGRAFLIANTGLSSVLTILMALDIFFVGYIATGLRPMSEAAKDNPIPVDPIADAQRLEAESKISPVIISHPRRGLETKPSPIPVPDIQQSVLDESVSSETNGPSKPRNLLESFIVYIAKERPYLDPDFSVADVCEALNTNRTYISELMADNFKMPFRDYVGVLRITLAKKLLRDDPGRTLEDIAADSGFASASQLVKKFKEITGTTPRAWLSMHV